MARQFEVGLRFGVKDGITKRFGIMTQAAARFGRSAEKSFKRASRGASKFQSVTAGFLKAQVIGKGVGLLTQGLGEVTRQFIGFDQAIISSSAKFKNLDITTERGRLTLEQLKKTAREVGAETQFNAAEAASGLDFLAMAGFSASQAMASLPGVVDLATVANVDLALATDIASDSLGAFGLMTDDANQLQQNFTRQNDVMAKTMTSSNTSMVDLFESIKKGAPAFTAAGQSIETFNTLAGIMANSGVKGSESGTQLRNVMLRLAKPTKEAQAQLDSLGIKTTDTSGNFLDVVDVLSQFETGLDGMGTAQRTAALATVFGARSVTGINILLAEGTKKIRGFREELINSAGASKTMADIMRDSLGNRLKSLSSASSELGFKILDVFSGDAKGGIESLTEAIREFDVVPIIAGLQTVLDLVGKIGTGWVLIGEGVADGVVKAAEFTEESKVLQFLNTGAQQIAGGFGLGNLIGNALGLGGEDQPQQDQGPGSAGFSRQAPNLAEATARAQQSRFRGTLNINGAPAGSTLTTQSPVPGFDPVLQGAN